VNATTVRKLRPAKVQGAVRRRWFERELERIPLSRGFEIVHLGSSYGGWLMPEDVIESSWVCYCVGTGGDITFDLELIRRYGAEVRAFDAVADYVRHAADTAAGEPRFSVRQAAIATSDGPLRMQVTHDDNSRSVSAAALYESAEYVELPGRTVPSLMTELGDERIDLLKLDIEGGEYDVVPSLDLRALGVKVFATQLHHNGSVAQARDLLSGLRDAGYEPVACDSPVKLTFVARDLL
jgi:FkbM family methyltransferase